MEEKYIKALERMEASQASFEKAALTLTLGEYVLSTLPEKGEISLADLSNWAQSVQLSVGKRKALKNFLSKINSSDS